MQNLAVLWVLMALETERETLSDSVPFLAQAVSDTASDIGNMQTWKRHPIRYIFSCSSAVAGDTGNIETSCHLLAVAAHRVTF